MKNLLFAMELFGMSVALAPFAAAKPLEVGDAFPKVEATDQHEKPYAVEAGTAYVLVSYDMGPGKQANAYLEEQGVEFLPNRKAVFIANIHEMPGVGRFFAIPKMQKYPHRIMLADEKGLLDKWPQEKGKVTVFALDAAGVITGISYWSPKDGSAPF